ncbi:3,4-dioxygenase subunit beta [uncultured Corynebacterium sp.]|uniref:dioxygenase family protein n=1 Tax=uncultured Corynebacterium sp. TaxID=159447 RepID=UPI0025FE008C|nr:3,4-dioxygenase subunit beta [uncultured Corynebacterium sp.]
MSTQYRYFEGRRLDHPGDDIEDQGLAFDMRTMVSRRRVLGIFGISAGAAALAACSPGGTSMASSSAAPSASTTTSTNAAAKYSGQELSELNNETAGPYPGDGSNGPDILDESGVERRDLTTSVDGNGSVEGVPMTLTMNLIDIANDNQPLAGAAVYVWHCNGEGEYSMYSDGVTDQTWLRGVQVTDDNGSVTFDSIVPGCNSGRWPHIHFEVFTSIDEITDASNSVLTSQIVVPEEVARACYSDSVYAGSADNLNNITLETDNVFSDGWDAQTSAVSGSKTAGYQLGIDVPVDSTDKATGGQPPAGGNGLGQGGPGGGPGEGGGTPPEPPAN